MIFSIPSRHVRGGKKVGLGSFELLELRSLAGSHSMKVVPGFGATLVGLQLNGHNLLDAYTSESEMLAYKWMKSALLFPFPNRLKNGTYIWNNDTYHFHINDAITGNALHGFGMDKPFEVVQTKLNGDYASLTCRYEHNGELPAYPFPFTVEASYSFDREGAFNFQLFFYNDGPTAIPVGLGWHPYFQLNEDISRLKMQLPRCEMIGIDQYMIPTGKQYEYDEFASLRKIGATVLDNCFEVARNPDPTDEEVLLQSDHLHLRYWQRTGPRAFNFLQIFTHPDRHAIALEPMSCNINAFNNGEGWPYCFPVKNWT